MGRVRSKICGLGFGFCEGLPFAWYPGGRNWEVADELTEVTPCPAPGPDSDTLRSSDWGTGLSSSFVRDRFIAEWGTNAPGVLKGYIVLKTGLLVVNKLGLSGDIFPCLRDNILP